MMSIQRGHGSATHGPGGSEAVTFDRRRPRSGRLTNGAGTRAPASEGNGAQLPCPRLYERDAWLDELKSNFIDAWPRSGAVIVEGAPGLGKTALLNSACRLAREAHLDVLYARGGELEADCPFGVTRQLFRPILARLDAGELARCDVGSAARFLQTVGHTSGSREADRLGVLDDLH